MAKVTREHLMAAHQKNMPDAELAKLCGVSKQAVYAMRKKYFPAGMLLRGEVSELKSEPKSEPAQAPEPKKVKPIKKS